LTANEHEERKQLNDDVKALGSALRDLGQQLRAVQVGCSHELDVQQNRVSRGNQGRWRRSQAARGGGVINIHSTWSHRWTPQIFELDRPTFLSDEGTNLSYCCKLPAISAMNATIREAPIRIEEPVDCLRK